MCIVWWSFVWTDGQIVVTKLERVSFLILLTDQRLSANWLCENIKKICWWYGVHRSLQPRVCCPAGSDFSMNSKDGRNCLLVLFLFYSLKCQCWFIIKRPSPKRTEINWSFHLFFHRSSRTKTIALKICLCKRESSCYPNCWYIYIG